VAAWEKVKSIKDNFAPQRKKLEEISSGLIFKLRIGKLRRKKKSELHCGGHLQKNTYWNNYFLRRG